MVIWFRSVAVAPTKIDNINSAQVRPPQKVHSFETDYIEIVSLTSTPNPAELSPETRAAADKFHLMITLIAFDCNLELLNDSPSSCSWQLLPFAPSAGGFL